MTTMHEAGYGTAVVKRKGAGLGAGANYVSDQCRGEHHIAILTSITRTRTKTFQRFKTVFFLCVCVLRFAKKHFFLSVNLAFLLLSLFAVGSESDEN